VDQISNENLTAAEVVSGMNTTIQSIFDSYPPDDDSVYDSVNTQLLLVQDGLTTGNNETYFDAFYNVYGLVTTTIYQTFGLESPGSAFEQPAANATAGADGFSDLESDFNVMAIIFIYFFVAAGVTLILMGVLNILTLPHSCFTKKAIRHPGVWVRMGAFFIVGAPLAAIAALVNLDAGANLVLSVWLLPLVVFCLLIVLVVQYIKLPDRMRKSDEKD